MARMERMKAMRAQRAALRYTDLATDDAEFTDTELCDVDWREVERTTRAVTSPNQGRTPGTLSEGRGGRAGGTVGTRFLRGTVVWTPPTD